MRGMTRETGVSDALMRQIVKQIGASSKARIKRFLLTDCLKATRLEKAKLIVAKMKKKMPIILFMDKLLYHPPRGQQPPEQVH